jgi:hypothetical protein
MKKQSLLTLWFLSLICISSLQAQKIENVTRDENKFIYSNEIKLFLGDSIYVKANTVNKSLTDFALVKGIIDSANIIFIRFSYDNFGSNKACLLKVVNPYSKTLVYKARIPNRAGKYFETSIMPIVPKIYGIEMWPNRFENIILSDFQLK